jgi:hypothetical protein
VLHKVKLETISYPEATPNKYFQKQRNQPLINIAHVLRSSIKVP